MPTIETAPTRLPGVVWAGESVDLVNDIPAADIIERVVAQAAATLRRALR
ncbi:MAG TPA: hypothetical protein VGR45_05810 [Stellaceae bacterium]|nr:hypothetical protein [Stellaceae bacterium]